jgi:putative two-component system response regulator
VYKQAQTHAKARETIVSGSGRHFDPDIVGAFLATEERFESVAKKLADVAEEPMRLAA